MFARISYQPDNFQVFSDSLLMITKNVASMQNIIKIILLILVVQENFVKCPNIDELRTSVSVEEQRAFIKISVLLNKATYEIHDDLQRALGNRVYSLRYVEILTKQYRSRE